LLARVSLLRLTSQELVRHLPRNPPSPCGLPPTPHGLRRTSRRTRRGRKDLQHDAICDCPPRLCEGQFCEMLRWAARRAPIRCWRRGGFDRSRRRTDAAALFRSSAEVRSPPRPAVPTLGDMGETFGKHGPRARRAMNGLKVSPKTCQFSVLHRYLSLIHRELRRVDGSGQLASPCKTAGLKPALPATASRNRRGVQSRLLVTSASCYVLTGSRNTTMNCGNWVLVKPFQAELSHEK
jgi:hypothetical protein